MFDALVHRQNAYIARPRKPSMVQKRGKASEGLAVSVARNKALVHRIRPRQMENRFGNRVTTVVQKALGFVAEQFRNPVDVAFRRNGHEVILYDSRSFMLERGKSSAQR